jgi:hypothetical protein
MIVAPADRVLQVVPASNDISSDTAWQKWFESAAHALSIPTRPEPMMAERGVGVAHQSRIPIVQCDRSCSRTDGDEGRGYRNRRIFAKLPVTGHHGD